MARNRQVEVVEGDVAVAEKTAEDLIAHLVLTGTPVATIRGLEEWYKANKGASADALYRHMEGAIVSQGTLRKAGKWTFGAEFEPEDVVKMAPADELLRLRQENERFSSRIAELQADKLGLMNQRTYQEEQIAELTRKVQFLSMGKSKEELSQIGM